MPPTPCSPTGSNRTLSRHGTARLPHPLVYRLLSTLLPSLATLLLLTTVYLFHLHHAHHHPEDDAANLDSLGRGAGGGANSPGGSALRHKLDLAHFLLQKHDQETAMEQGDMKEAMELGGWKGGDEDHFIRMVKEAQQGAAVSATTTTAATAATEATATEATATAATAAATGIACIEINNKKWKEEDAYAATLPKLSWKQLQQTLLAGNLLPPPIPPARTARGFSGLPPARAPALEGAHRGTIVCPDTVPRVGRVLSSMLAFWNEPRGTRDLSMGGSEAGAHVFVPPPLSDADLPPWSPGRVPRRRYLTFEPDTGGWNNLRISFENVLLLAAVSGRTLVLPPEQSMYLLEPRKGADNERNYDDMVQITDNVELLRRVPVITAREFLRLEGSEGGLVPLAQYNATWQEHLLDIAAKCEERRKSDAYCEDLYDHYRDNGRLAAVTTDEPYENCFVFDADVFHHGEDHVAKLAPEIIARIKKFCRLRTPVYYNRTVHEAPLWHFETMDLEHRLLVHPYAFLFFTDPKVDNYYKRFVRDFLRFHDAVYCAAGKIILALQYEDYLRNKALTFAEDGKSPPSLSLSLDHELVGGYSSLHIRRGDLQFTEVKFNASQWYQNTKELWRPHEVLYIATDERDRSWFGDFRTQHAGPLRFFDDYKELADLDSIDPTLYGMIDTVVASRGDVFAGTWFSTFSGYIIRLRGYYGMSKYFSYYSWLERKFFMNAWMDVGDGSYYAREYPVGWTSIDGDEFVDGDNEGKKSAGPIKFVDKIADKTRIPRYAMDRYKATAATKLLANRDSRAKYASRVSSDGTGLARGIAGRPMEATPALVGAKRGHVTCDADVDALAYWNEPQGTRDLTFASPFRSPGPKDKYLVFTFDMGGFNNVRMSFEIISILSAALGRILVLPPEKPMYLLRQGSKKHHGLDGFFEMEGKYYKERVKYMTMEQFVLKEGHSQGQYPVPPEKMDDLLRASRVCAPRGRESDSCDVVHDFLEQHSTTPAITAAHHECLVFDEGMYEKGVPDDMASAEEFCSSGKRKLVWVTKEIQEPSLLYVQGGKKNTRMLAHYYGYLHFTDVAIGNYYKRYVRDLLRLKNEIFCAAGKIVKSLQDAAKERGFSVNSEGGGGYSSLHVRRGDFQYKKMRLSAEEWYANTNELWKQKEVLYIATDEKEKSFFEPFRLAGHTLYFLGDFTDLAKLDDMDSNWMGMIDSVVASQGRAFVGTFRSTFSGYINRLRGYYGLSMKDSWFGQREQKDMMHEFHNVNFDTYAKEWPDGWLGIDADVAPSQDIF